MKKIFLFFLLMFCFLFSCGNPSSSESSNVEDLVTVELAESEYYDILSNNPITVKKGGNVAFKVDIVFGRMFDSSDDGYFVESESVFRVENVQKSCVVSFTTKVEGDCVLTLLNDDDKGDCIITPNRYRFEIGEEVTIETVPHRGQEFMCYSHKYAYRNAINSEGTGMPLSFTNKYTFVIEKNITIHVNYFEKDLLRMEYDANGGRTIDNQESFVVDYHCAKPQINPVTILGTYYLFRDGYTLESYNTEKDGTGTRVGIGSKVDISFSDDNKIKLYAQWKKWTQEKDFEIENIDQDNVAISKYIGESDNKEVIIPNVINGRKVMCINSNAFENRGIEIIIFNLDLVTVEQKAINNCNELKEIIMFTNIESIKNNSIVSTSLKTIFINSTVYAKDYITQSRDITSQIDQIRAMENDRVIFVGQTTLRYNHDLTPFKEVYPEKDFYLYGMQEGANFALPLDLLINFLSENDTVIISLLEPFLKNNYIGAFTFVYLKYNFDLLSLINYQDYSDMFFASYEKFIPEVESGYYKKVFNSEKEINFDAFGGLKSGSVSNKEENYDASYVPKFEIYQKEENFVYFNEIMNKSKVLKENRFITWSTYNENSVKDLTIFENFESYVKSILVEFNYFDSIKDNIYSGEFFIEKSSTTLSTVGGDARVDRWLRKIPLST